MIKIKGTEGQGLLQMIIRMIRTPPCSSVPLQVVICKDPPDDQNQGDRGARIVANDHPGDLASFVLLRSFAKRTVLGMTDISLVG